MCLLEGCDLWVPGPAWQPLGELEVGTWGDISCVAMSVLEKSGFTIVFPEIPRATHMSLPEARQF